MIKYKIDILDALKRKGFTSYTAKKSGILSQNSMQSIKKESPTITLATLDKLCMLLDLQPKDLIEYIPDEKD